jgi:hypothetical protein
VLIDLTDQSSIDGRHVDVILEAITPEEERWSISVPSATDPEILARLRQAGHHVIEHHHRS